MEVNRSYDHGKQGLILPQADVPALGEVDPPTTKDVEGRTYSVQSSASPGPEPMPKLFLELCCAACVLGAQKKPEVARDVVRQASEIFASMVYSNIHALTCIGILSITLAMQGRKDDAREILTATRTAALAKKLQPSDPIIVMVTFMTWQTTATREKDVIELDQLRTAHEQFETLLGPRHPYTIVAGYKLAWRLAMTDTCRNKKLEAFRILHDLQEDADVVLRSLHIQSIAITMTRARVLNNPDVPHHSH